MKQKKEVSNKPVSWALDFLFLKLWNTMTYQFLGVPNKCTYLIAGS